MKGTQYIGVLTAGGDSPGLNAAIRGIGKAAINHYGMQIVGFRDGFRGLMENRTMPLDTATLSGILTVGGTILGTSRDKPNVMPVGGKLLDMTDVIVDNYHRNQLNVLVCLGGGGTQKNALHLAQRGLNIITLPKTIDNDVAMTDVTFGFDTALGIATEAIDRLHSTAHSHHRIIVVEIMGNKVGWLALGAGIAGGADVILVPEIPYDVEVIAEAIRQRNMGGRGFSIVAVAEGAMSRDDYAALQKAEEDAKGAKGAKDTKGDKDSKGGKKKDKKDKDREKDGRDFRKDAADRRSEEDAGDLQSSGRTLRLAQRLEQLTGLESRVTILGHVQRGGTPSAADRLLATRLGTATADMIHSKTYGVMVAVRGEEAVPVPLADVAGKRKTIPLDHPWIASARRVGTCLGD